ncbi:hypothetical protein SAMN04488134_101772 [Amphibacillus marinus]|uniref:Dit-like phage tail protein N-terminal domain-containing protein n=1 Tax=Amphibacillus marinus TaxID=872970 RepID=A0A1H8IYH6_9BACI|nr:hypothetical protein [Amphibacillus marinus]SEN73552.1 hypothetical protein SAMN04488134_101772 [Amphibacillus marinus]
MAIGFFIEYSGQIAHFPVNPESVVFSKNSSNESTEIVGLGEINVLGITSLGEMTFESFFPGFRHASYVRTKNKFWNPKRYIDLIEKIRRQKKPCRFVITHTLINTLVSIESFEYEYRAGEENDVYFSITLKEYRPYDAKFVKVVQQVSRPTTPKVTKKPTKSKSTNKQVTTGSTVIVNGRLHRDSYGAGPGQTEKNARRKVNFIKKGRKCPYHVTNLNGGWRGWVTASSVRRVD